MGDREFLIWIYQRLVKVYGEDELVDYMHKLRSIIADTSLDRVTPNDGRGGNSMDKLIKRLASEPVGIPLFVSLRS